MRVWRRILLKATAAAVLSVAASVGLALTLVPALGGVVDGNAWLMCILCPLLISFPASAWQFRQKERLFAAYGEIAELHGRLAEAHSQLTATHAELAERARHDGLTGLLNRDGFFVALERSTAEQESGVLLVADADHFKSINDRFGHPVGDAALRAIAGAVEEVVGERGFCGRIGGEEFAIYLPGSDAGEALRLAVGALQLETGDGRAVPLSVSIGGAHHAGPAAHGLLVIEADRQLYAAKNHGRDRVVLAAVAEAA